MPHEMAFMGFSSQRWLRVPTFNNRAPKHADVVFREPLREFSRKGGHMYGVFEVSEKTKSKPQTASRNGERKVVETKASGRPPKVDFASGLLENSDLKQPRRSLDFLLSLAGQAAFVALLILLPLLYTQAFDVSGLEKTMLVIPPPPPPPPKAEPHVVIKPKASLFDKGKLIAPRVIPKHVEILKEAPQESPGPAGVSGGVIGGVEGGTLGGVLGGILSGSQPPPPPPRPAKVSGPLRVGGRIQAPHLIKEAQPEYPVLAKDTRTQGDVVLDCVIDQQGNVTQMRLVSGHPLLVQAALKAVQQWKYQPTLLNGEPVAVEMKVTVTFSLGNQ
jgi:periplasmic protein TonB